MDLFNKDPQAERLENFKLIDFVIRMINYGLTRDQVIAILSRIYPAQMLYVAETANKLLTEPTQDEQEFLGLTKLKTDTIEDILDILSCAATSDATRVQDFEQLKSHDIPILEDVIIGEEKASITFGRNPTNDIVLDNFIGKLDDVQSFSSISREHAALSKKDGHLWIKNLSSTSPVLVDGIPLPNLEEAPLKNGSLVQLGPDPHYTYRISQNSYAPEGSISVTIFLANTTNEKNEDTPRHDSEVSEEPVEESSLELENEKLVERSIGEITLLEEKLKTYEQRIQAIPDYLRAYLPVGADRIRIKELLTFIKGNIDALQELQSIVSEPNFDPANYRFAYFRPTYKTGPTGTVYEAGFDYTERSYSELQNLVQQTVPEILEKLQLFLDRTRILDSLDFYNALEQMSTRIISEALKTGNPVLLYLDTYHASRSHGYVTFLVNLILEHKLQNDPVFAGRQIPFARIVTDHAKIKDDPNQTMFILDDFVLRGVKMASYFEPQKRASFERLKIINLAILRLTFNYDDIPDLETVYTSDTPTLDKANITGFFASSTICNCDYIFTGDPTVGSLIKSMDVFPRKLQIFPKTQDRYSHRKPANHELSFKGTDKLPELLNERADRIYTHDPVKQKVADYLAKKSNI